MGKGKLSVLGVASALVFLFGSGSVLAQDKAPGSGPNPFTDCGIGASLFPDTHWAAVTSNIIWDVGTTALISATASPETCKGASAKAAMFINDTYDNVLVDTARGDGEYVTALLEIYSCDAVAHGDVVEAIRGDISEIVSADGYADLSQLQKAESYFKVIDSEIRGSFAASCSA